MNRSKSLATRLAALGAVFAVASVLFAGSAGAAMSEAEVTRMIEQTYGVEVLRVRADRLGDDPVWMVTVMNPPGTFNEAFQVNTLAVNQETGALIPNFRHGPNGVKRPGGGGRGDKAGLRPDAQRSGTWR